jgi:putative endonuclease
MTVIMVGGDLVIDGLALASCPRTRASRKEMKAFYVYILCNKRNGALYIGVTSDIVRRVYEHREHLVDGFTKRYSVTNLVWFEKHETALSAINREKQLKHWQRTWKLELIERENPDWEDLYEKICR